MIRRLSILLAVVLTMASVVKAEDTIPPPHKNSGIIGGRAADMAWRLGRFQTLELNGVEYAFPSTDGTNGQVLATDGSGTFSWAASAAATAWDDIAAPDANKTLAFTTYTSTLTGTSTAADQWNFQGLGAFGDVSVMRIEQKTGNPTDGTVLEVVAADANVDPLVISSSGLANAFVVGQNAGATTVNGALVANGAVTLGDDGDTVAIDSSDWNISTTGALTGVASVGYDNGTTEKTVDVAITSAQMKAIRATPIALVPATAGAINELVSAVIVMDYGSEVLTETADNLVIEYEDGVDTTAAIETTGFIDQNADQVALIKAATVPTITAAGAVNKALQLKNTGDGEFGGNASNDTSFTVKVVYRTHAVTL